MGRILVTLMLIGGLLWSFSYLTSDPFGATTRTTIETQAAVEIAQNQAQAAVQVAEWQAQAQIESAQAAAEADKVAAQEQRRSSETWATILPVLLVIVAKTGALWIILTYQGRVFLALVQQRVNGGRPAPVSGLDALFRRTESRQYALTAEEQLARYAEAHNQRVLKRDGSYLLVDKRTNQVVKQLVLKG